MRLYRVQALRQTCSLEDSSSGWCQRECGRGMAALACLQQETQDVLWCLVNRKARIVIFFYEDTTDDESAQKHGGRNRNVLKEYFSDVGIKSLQSDGYNVYMHFDNKLIDIEHLCCLTLTREKIKYAYDHSCLRARILLKHIAKLYGVRNLPLREN